jgi:hypothetical protein
MKFLIIQLLLAIPALLLQTSGVAYFFNTTLGTAGLWVGAVSLIGFAIGYFANKWILRQIGEASGHYYLY